LERAQAFAQGAMPSSGTPPASLTAFRELLGRYRDLVDTLDRIRRDQTGDEARRTLSGPLETLEASAAAVRAALRAEGWPAPQARGSSMTRLSSFTVARSDDTDCPSCGCTTCGASSASGSRTKRRLCISGCGILSERFSITSWSQSRM